jgi:hypothetical protein
MKPWDNTTKPKKPFHLASSDAVNYMGAGILYAIITILNNLSCIIHIITTHKSSVLLLQMDLSIFTAPPKKKVFEDTHIFGQTIVE